VVQGVAGSTADLHQLERKNHLREANSGRSNLCLLLAHTYAAATTTTTANEGSKILRETGGSNPL
jgi:hypothetical protein